MNKIDRAPRLKAAAGLVIKKIPQEDVVAILRFMLGIVFQHEINAVCLTLHSTHSAFNEGVDTFLQDKNENACPYDKSSDYANYILWITGYDACKLAIELYGKEEVIKTL